MEEQIPLNVLTELVEGDGKWAKFLHPLVNSEVAQPIWNELERLENQARKYGNDPYDVVYPEPIKMFNAFAKCPFDQTKVVILGQDPYPTPGNAHGLAFSVDNEKAKTPYSLKQIFQEVWRTYRQDENIVSLQTIDPTYNNLERWAEQGVLLLNTALTFPKGGEPGEHINLWKGFSKALMLRLNEELPEDTIWILWGRKAQEYLPFIDNNRHHILCAPHPASERYTSKDKVTVVDSYSTDAKKHFLSANRFKDCRHFYVVNQLLHSFNKKEINW